MTYRHTFVCVSCARGTWQSYPAAVVPPKCGGCGERMIERGGLVAAVDILAATEGDKTP